MEAGGCHLTISVTLCPISDISPYHYLTTPCSCTTYIYPPYNHPHSQIATILDKNTPIFVHFAILYIFVVGKDLKTPQACSKYFLYIFMNNSTSGVMTRNANDPQRGEYVSQKTVNTMVESHGINDGLNSI